MPRRTSSLKSWSIYCVKKDDAYLVLATVPSCLLSLFQSVMRGHSRQAGWPWCWQAFLISVLCFLHLFEKMWIEPQIYAFLHVFQWSLTQVVPGTWVKASVLKSTRWEQKWQLWDDGSYRYPGKVKDPPRAELPPTPWGSCSLGPGTCGCGVTGSAYTPARWIPSSQQPGGWSTKKLVWFSEQQQWTRVPWVFRLLCQGLCLSRQVWWSPEVTDAWGHVGKSADEKKTPEWGQFSACPAALWCSGFCPFRFQTLDFIHWLSYLNPSCSRDTGSKCKREKLQSLNRSPHLIP